LRPEHRGPRHEDGASSHVPCRRVNSIVSLKGRRYTFVALRERVVVQAA
jgi:hypothetical protein